ncbi:LytTR family DNA-binding domain-containing protein [Cytophagaceae bacterium DM2B3-1]|uniref:LytTR family DNA-binding domain-containing protein n=1 Tax=Xanthocytophaga flava TaxID=3048013 RepID=A0AAE3QTS8_9BACT|nr:LytTR family DNA-binding domain-containing protein [Xanthocytophaga flavus]MDJ1469834.1 LytTR family DNA-binding domain-containing protein [Xanthocytophaga flavus]MDJ1483238.1 LytTR family DNA-binding domain-containing protein [Xanthocytophaga flavus]MDJ1494347.1 LytTR family DNA-binding domain-containing protein [Xanthocytophaga flavus]
MKILIIEDEDLAVRKLQRTVQEIDPEIDIVGVAGSVRESVTWLDKHPAPDLILMDIELADGQSFEIFEQTEVTSPVIFTTSYDEYAIQAFKVNSIDYLLKPIQKADLQRSLQKFNHLQHQSSPSMINIEKLIRELQVQTRDYRKRFLVKQGQRLVSFEVNDIAYFFMEDRFCFFRTRTNQKFLVDYTMDELETELDPKYFFRINRSFIVSQTTIDQIQNYFGNRLALTLKPVCDKEVLVSREKVSDFKEWMGK